MVKVFIHILILAGVIGQIPYMERETYVSLYDSKVVRISLK